MQFLNPFQLFWLLLLALPIALYLFRRQADTVRVSTLNFFKTLAKEHSESAWLRWLKRLISFLLTVLILTGVVGALARPVLNPSSDRLKSVVILVDRSASMEARGENGQRRLDTGLEQVERRLSGLPDGVRVMVMTYDRRPEILRSFTLERRRVHRTLEQIDVRPVEGNPERALPNARRLASFHTPSAVWHVTDDGMNDSTDPQKNDPGNEDVKTVTIRADNPSEDPPLNAGITAFQLRRKPMNPGQIDAFLGFHCTASDPVEAKLEVRINGRLHELQNLSLSSGQQKNVLVPIEAESGQLLDVNLSVEGDVVNADNHVQGFIPDFDPVQVHWVHNGKRPFTRMSLLSMEAAKKIKLVEGGPDTWPPDESENEPKPDVVLFDGWMPDQWPEDVAVTVIDPPESSGPIQVASLDEAMPVPNVRNVNRLHPVAFGVGESRLTLRQTAILDAQGPLDPIWVGSSGPLLAAGTIKHQRVTVLSFAPEDSGRFPLQASYPILFGNVIFWSAGMHNSEGNRETGNASVHRTGEVIRLKGSRLHWVESVKSDEQPSTTNTDVNLKRTHTTELDRPWVELKRTGLWKTDKGERGSSLLLSAKETMLHKAASDDDPSTDRSDPEQQQPIKTTRNIFTGDLTSMLLWFVVILLLAESWLRHRWAVY